MPATRDRAAWSGSNQNRASFDKDGATQPVGQTFLSAVSPGQTFLSAVSPGQTFLSAVSPGQTFLSAVSPGQTFLSAVSPGQTFLSAPPSRGFGALSSRKDRRDRSC